MIHVKELVAATPDRRFVGRRRQVVVEQLAERTA
jgi:hypothetical protein